MILGCKENFIDDDDVGLGRYLFFVVVVFLGVGFFFRFFNGVVFFCCGFYIFMLFLNILFVIEGFLCFFLGDKFLIFLYVFDVVNEFEKKLL